jgi:2-oxoglutarate dehydrogenase complex dehydrogenase (E1) component-like enzyme
MGRVSGLVLSLPTAMRARERSTPVLAPNSFSTAPREICRSHSPRRPPNISTCCVASQQPFRKPLVVLTPKSLLRNPDCVSRLDEFTGGWFREVLTSSADPEKVTAVLVCSGKLYYELAIKRAQENRDDTAIIRIEQLYPLRDDLLREELGRFRHVRSCTWVQEEP